MSATTAAPAAGEPNEEPRIVMMPPANVPPADPDIRERTGSAYLKSYHEDLVPDIAKNGVLVPLIVTMIAGVMRLIDGETRRRAALEVGLKEVPVYVIDGPVDESDLEIIQHKLNKKRLKMTMPEEAAFYLRTMKAKGWSQAKLCRELVLDPSQVNKLLRALSDLDKTLFEKLGKGESQISLRAGYALCDAPKEKQADFADMYLLGEWSIQTLEQKCRIAGGKKAKEEPEQTLKGDGWKLIFEPRKYDVALKEAPAALKKWKDSPAA